MEEELPPPSFCRLFLNNNMNLPKPSDILQVCDVYFHVYDFCFSVLTFPYLICRRLMLYLIIIISSNIN